MSSRIQSRLVRSVALLITLAATFFLSPVARGDEEFTLKNDFIEMHKNKATITATYTVDKAHTHPNPAEKDGDMHVAGRAPEIGLPTVAEIMNARLEDSAVALVHQVEGKDQAIKVTGAWRLWAEHGGNSPQNQGDDLEPFKTTNPEHVFEIHPLTQVGPHSVLNSFEPIVGFPTKDAEQAFSRYERLKCRLVPGTGTTTIITEMAGFNYVEFVLKFNGEQEAVDDGRMAFAEVQTLSGEPLVRNRRMVFVKGTDPETKVKGLAKGDRVHVLGIPRIDLALVSFRTHHADDASFKGKDILNWNLPYEIIVVAVYGRSHENEPVETQFVGRRHTKLIP
jgi:hypothetical protein